MQSQSTDRRSTKLTSLSPQLTPSKQVSILPICFVLLNPVLHSKFMDNIQSLALAPLPKNDRFLSLQCIEIKFSESLGANSLAIVVAFFPALKAWLS